MSDFVMGQRWTSEMEPELGVGVVDAVDGRRIHLRFPESGLVRIYAAASAPLRRVVFHPGDRVTAENGTSLTISEVDTRDGLNVYCGDGRRLREDQLSGSLTVNRPNARIMAGQRDAAHLFDLRVRLIDHRLRAARSPVHGFVGGRVELIPHQFAIAAEVSARRFPRVLLADETGLGKTIEAGLILHRLTTLNRVTRVLVIVPDALVVQWYVELARRFNLRFRILDETFETDQPKTSAGDGRFDDEPLALCGFDFLSAASPTLQTQLTAAGWDMLVVDEAHRMRPGDRIFRSIRRLAETSHGLILITATPGQLSARGHFARLRLLDPQRYPDYRQFIRQNRDFEQIATLAKAIDEGTQADTDSIDALSRLLAMSAGAVHRTMTQTGRKGETARRRLIQILIDRHGTGRAMFRTRRKAVPGFPGRKVHLVPLDVHGDRPGLMGRLFSEFLQDCGLVDQQEDNFLDNDPRVSWLTSYLRGHRNEKTLLICRSSQKVKALMQSLEKQTNIKVGRFHEGMTLVQRDRNAAWFAEPDGAMLLICSEIGSEGRNFQFARHLVLFDLPVDPELLEQRIGRLDRIGQTGVVQVLVPFVCESAGEVMARWYHEALNAFETHSPAAAWVTRRLLGALADLINTPDWDVVTSRLGRLIRSGRIAARRQQRRIDSGRDRLLQQDGLPLERAVDLIDTIRQADGDSGFVVLVEQLLDVWGIVSESVAPGIFRLLPDHRYAHPLPGFRPSGLTVTTDRAIALTREDLDFLTWDHPLVVGAMELFLGSGQGNVAFVHWRCAGSPLFLLEMIFIVEGVASPDLFLERFLPPTPIRVVVDQDFKDGESRLTDSNPDTIADGPASLFTKMLPAISHRIPDMVDAGRSMAQARALPTIEAARRLAGQVMDDSVSRIVALQRANAAIGDLQIETAKQERDAVMSAISRARVRFDAMRLIVKGSQF